MAPPGWKRFSSNSSPRSPRSNTRRYWQYGSKVLPKADSMILLHCIDQRWTTNSCSAKDVLRSLSLVFMEERCWLLSPMISVENCAGECQWILTYRYNPAKAGMARLFPTQQQLNRVPKSCCSTSSSQSMWRMSSGSLGFMVIYVEIPSNVLIDGSR